MKSLIQDESADRWSSRLVSPRFLNQFELDAGHSIVEVNTPQEWVGRTLIDIRPRSELGVHVVAIKRTPKLEQGGPGRPILYVPMPDVPLEKDDLLLLMGRDVDLARLPENKS